MDAGDDDAYGVVADAASRLGIDLDLPVRPDLSEFSDLELPQPQTLDEALQLGSGIRSDIKTGLDGTDRLHAKELAGLRKAGSFVDQHIFEADVRDPIQQRRLEKLKPVYDREYGERFKVENAVKGATPGQQIAKHFWKPDTDNGTALARWYRFVFKDDPEALDDIAAAAADDLRRHVGMDRDRVGSWMDMRKQALRSFPEIEKAVKDDPMTVMADRAQEASSIADRAEDARLHKLLGEQKIEPKLSNAREIMARIGGDDQAVPALKRAIWSGAYSNEPTASGMEKFGLDNGELLTRVMGKEHHQNLLHTIGGIRMSSGGDVDPMTSVHHHLPGMGPGEGRALMMSAFARPGVAADLAGAVRLRGANAKQYRGLVRHLLGRGL